MFISLTATHMLLLGTDACQPSSVGSFSIRMLETQKGKVLSAQVESCGTQIARAWMI